MFVWHALDIHLYVYAFIQLDSFKNIAIRAYKQTDIVLLISTRQKLKKFNSIYL